jgi:carboxylesterase
MTDEMASPNDQALNALQQAFAGPEHRPLRRDGGTPGALLVHGYVGSPAEMRPVADRLHQAGWSVNVPLLPGFGADIDTLFERDRESWLSAAREAFAKIRATHAPLLIVGYSMGGAVATAIAPELKPDGIILLAPFWQMPLNGSVWRWLKPVLRLVLPTTRPFKHIDFHAPEVRRGFAELMPALDLDDPDIQSVIRETTVPTRALAELDKLGQEAVQASRKVAAPTLVLQGTHDELVRRSATRQLLTKLGGPVSYQEVAAGHDLVYPDRQAWPAVSAAILRFASDLEARHRSGTA